MNGADPRRQGCTSKTVLIAWRSLRVSYLTLIGGSACAAKHLCRCSLLRRHPEANWEAESRACGTSFLRPRAIAIIPVPLTPRVLRRESRAFDKPFHPRYRESLFGPCAVNRDDERRPTHVSRTQSPIFGPKFVLLILATLPPRKRQQTHVGGHF